MILEASKDMYPREFGAFLRAEDGIITEILLAPGTISGNRHAIFQLHMLPTDFTVVGTIHSHPSGNFNPSDEDLALFRKFGGLHLIVGMPYDETSWAVWKHSGERISLEILP